MMYNAEESKRVFEEKDLYDAKNSLDREEFGTDYRRDLSRIIHSHSFRRLVGKTQLFPCGESDFFRNRLTHSLEVAQIAQTIALKLNHQISKRYASDYLINLDLVEIAGLAHDIGHPPFGHQGEATLAECMRNHGGFEGNAQSLRLLARLEKKIHNGELQLGGFDVNHADTRHGLNLSYRSLASILKYDNEIPTEQAGSHLIEKGYYHTERELVSQIKQAVTGGRDYSGKFKTVECQIMDIADDIAYSTYDLEDAFKANFISPIEMLTQSKEFYRSISSEISKNKSNDFEIDWVDVIDVVSDLFAFIFNLPPEKLHGIDTLQFDNSDDSKKEEAYLFLAQQFSSKYNELLMKNGYVRTNFSSQLIQASLKGVDFHLNEPLPALSVVTLDRPTRKRIEILKKIAFKTQVLSPKLKSIEHRGSRIIRTIFESLLPNGVPPNAPPELLPNDYKIIYEQSGTAEHRYRTVCDYIAGMTDNYALEFYSRLTSERAPSIFRSM